MKTRRAAMILALATWLVLSLTAWAENASRSVLGYAEWSKMGTPMKVFYVSGYADAQALYTELLVRLKDHCDDTGKEHIANIMYNLPAIHASTGQMVEGIDAFYKDWRNKAALVDAAMRVVRLQLGGRPQGEVDEAIRDARAPRK